MNFFQKTFFFFSSFFVSTLSAAVFQGDIGARLVSADVYFEVQQTGSGLSLIGREKGQEVFSTDTNTFTEFAQNRFSVKKRSRGFPLELRFRRRGCF